MSRTTTGHVGGEGMRLYWIPLFVFVVGVSVMSVYRSAPHYASDMWKSQVPISDWAQWGQAQAANTTRDSKLRHGGFGLAVFGLALGIWLAALGVRDWKSLRGLQTPATRVHLFFWTTVTILTSVHANNAWLRYTFNRGDYPWWGDSIVIGMFGGALTAAIFLPGVYLLLALCTWRSRLPVPLWLRPCSWRGWGFTVLAIPLAVWLILQLMDSVKKGNGFAIPLWMASLYLVASARAAAATTEETASGASNSLIASWPTR